MRTSELVTLLIEDKPPQTKPLWGYLLMAFAMSAGAFFILFTVRGDLTAALLQRAFVLKVSFTFSLALIACHALLKGMSPQDNHHLRGFLLPVFVVIGAFALNSLWPLPMMEKKIPMGGFLAQQPWLECLLAIPMLAVFSFVTLAFFAKQGATPHLRLQGFLLGLASGAIAACFYAFHCVEDSMAYVALYYSLAILFVGGIGALLAGKILRW
jgi:hypothetical protein